MKTAWCNHHHRGALCEKQEHEQLPLTTQGEERFCCHLGHLTKDVHSPQSLALKTPSGAINGKERQINEEFNTEIQEVYK